MHVCDVIYSALGLKIVHNLVEFDRSALMPVNYSSIAIKKRCFEVLRTN